MGKVEDLHLFTMVVEHRGIANAAARLNIAKSAVSRRLSLLEDRYSTRLIDRTPGRWEVTETGRELYQRATRAVNDFKEIETDLLIPYPTDGNLQRWATQGVLLLNAILTVRSREAGSHQNKGWEKFTDAVISNLSA